MNDTITVAIVEDKEPIRQSLAMLIDGADGFMCQTLFETAEAALAQLSAACVDVVLMEIDLPGMNGIDCVRQLKPLCPNTQFMMCTMRMRRSSMPSKPGLTRIFSSAAPRTNSSKPLPNFTTVARSRAKQIDCRRAGAFPAHGEQQPFF